MANIERRVCLNCNGRGNVPLLNAYGHDTGQNVDCSVCEGDGAVVPVSHYRGAVDVLEKIARAGEGVPDWRAMADAARGCLERMGYELPPRGGQGRSCSGDWDG